MSREGTRMDNKLNEITQNNSMMNVKKTDDFLTDMQGIIETVQKKAYHIVYI